MADAPPDARTCYGCGFESTQPVDCCIHCGGAMRSKKLVGRVGWVLIACGLILAGMGGGLILLIIDFMRRARLPNATVSYTGGPAATVAIFGILGIVLLFGIMTLVGGIGQIRHGRPNRSLVQIILWLAGALFVIGSLAELLD
jgi:hypothetical protein